MLVLLSPLLFYALADYFLRLANALMAPVLISRFALSADEIGFLTGAFFVGFGLMQFPLGIALDRYGPRPVLLVQLAVATMGALVCFIADGMWLMSLGRGLMGIGMAGSFMATLKAASLWLPPRQMVSVPGLVVAMTGLGGMMGSGPLAEIRGLDWESMNLILAMVGLVTFFWIGAAVPKCRPDQLSREPLRQQIKQSLRIYCRIDFWRFAPIVMTCTSTIVAYQTLWMTVWLSDVGGLSERGVAWSLFGALACSALGGFCVSGLTSLMERKRISLLHVVYWGGGISVAAQLALATGYGTLSVPLWFVMAFLYSATVAVYSIVARRYPSHLSARASANLNLLAFLGTFVIQWAFGGLISYYDPDPMDGYSGFAFRNAMVALASVQVAALVWCACIGRGGPKA